MYIPNKLTFRQSMQHFWASRACVPFVEMIGGKMEGLLGRASFHH